MLSKVFADAETVTDSPEALESATDPTAVAVLDSIEQWLCCATAFCRLWQVLIFSKQAVAELACNVLLTFLSKEVMHPTVC